MNSDTILTAQAMKDMYGAFYSSRPRIALDPGGVPMDLHPLIPYAEFWGVSDDWIRESLVDAAGNLILENLKTVVRLFQESLERWLTGPESHNPNPSDEYVAFSAMVMAADYA